MILSTIRTAQSGAAPIGKVCSQNTTIKSEPYLQKFALKSTAVLSSINQSWLFF